MRRPQANKHRIDRVRFILQTDGLLATQVQQRCSQVFHQQLQVQLNDVFNLHGVMSVDTLTLDLGQIAWREFDTQLCDKVLNQLSLQLSKFSAYPLAARSMEADEHSERVAPSPVTQDHEDFTAQDLSVKMSKSPPLSSDQSSLHLKSDQLPPSPDSSTTQPTQAEPNLPSAISDQTSLQFKSDRQSSSAEIAKSASTNFLAAQSDPNLRSTAPDQPSSQFKPDRPSASPEIAAHLPNDPLATQFESYLHSGQLAKPAWLGADEWLLAKLSENPRTWYLALARCCIQHRALQRLLQLYHPDTLRSISHQLSGSANRLAQSGHDTPAPYLTLGALRFFQLQPALAMPTADGMLQADTVQPELESWLELVQAEPPTPILQQWLRPLFDRPQLQSRLKQHVSQPLIAKLQALLKIPPLTREQPKSAVRRVPAPSSIASPNTPLPVSNAGLVLLWPLLPSLLTHLGLLQDKAFINEEAQHKAVCWLDWLIWKGDDASHFDRTSLTRYLCGVPLDTQIDPWHSPAEEQQVNMQHWLSGLPAQLPGLHRCSADDLCYLFLQRPGGLYLQKSPRRLQVEPHASDILLSQLPWPVNSILLPWLDYPLAVTWSLKGML